MSNSEEVSELAEIQKLLADGDIPIRELHRLLQLHSSKMLFDKRTMDEYANSGVHNQHVVYYADPVDVIEMRQRQGQKPDSIRCVKAGSMEFDVMQFNKELLKRATRAATRQRQRGIIQIGEPDEEGARAIIVKAEEKLKAQGRLDKPAILDALLSASTEARFVEEDVVENLKAIGCIALVEVGGMTRVSYKWQHRIGEYVKRLLKQHDVAINDICSQPQRDWGMSTNRFVAEVKLLLREMNLDDGSGLERVRPESLLVLDRLERMVESRPKTLSGLHNIIRPVAKTIFITPLNVTFARLAGVPAQLKTVKFPFSETSSSPFSLTRQHMFVTPEKAADDPTVGIKEAKKFYRKVFSSFHKAKKEEEWVQYRLATAEMKGDAVKKLQEWAENREKGIQSNCEKTLPTNVASSGVLCYKLACLDTAEGLQPLTRADIYAVLANLATTDVTLSPEDVIKKLEELKVLKRHSDKIVFFVNRIKKLVDDAEKANKKITNYVSTSIDRYKYKVAAESAK
ncbi:hypothetical protein LSAT2_014100 [Lamellibrachia satsuma]|nr:hypothetical protein LSAT2_014100 [Lamellibrachia satsuma]